MFSFFKSNSPAVVAAYIIYLVGFRVCLWFVPVDTAFVFEHSEPLSALLFAPLKNLGANYTAISAVLAAVLCFIQALIINGIVNGNKILAKKNYVAGALFLLFASFFKQALLLTPALLALTFVILATGRLFAIAKKEKSYGDVFDIGFLVAIAGLFYFPCMLLFLFAYIGLAIVRPFNYREWTILPLGFFSPILVVFTFYFWNDNVAILLPDMMNMHNSGWLVMPVLSLADKTMLGSIAFCTVVCLTLLPASLYSSLIQVRKFANALVVLIVLTLAAILLQQSIDLSHLVLLALPLGIISAMVLMQIKRNLVSEVSHLILLLLVLFAQFFVYLNLF
ncbi:MAG TPA: hypothetical protein VK154_13820 [Chitinophagales bacterium]|nr:hypothetical protein [Chitinophagales bacterium]